MSKKKKNIELKIYEFLGIKKFRKMAFTLVYICIIPVTLEMTKEERKTSFYNTPTSYTMKKGHGIQDLKDFKKFLLFNTVIHIYGLKLGIPYILSIISGTASLSTTIVTLLVTGLNSYCIMLQRYNYIRINQTIKKVKPREETKKSKLKEELIKEDSLLKEHTYKISNKRSKEKNITFEKLLETATYEQLKQYQDYLSYFKEISNEQLNVSIPFKKNKTLKLELKSENENSN